MILVQIFGTLLGAVIVMRAVSVISKMDMRSRSEHYLAWLGFGLSYALLAVSAVGSILALWAGSGQLGALSWLCASAGLILFDRRKRRRLLSSAGG